MRKQFHIVCEGPTDFQVFKSIVAKVGRINGSKYSAKELFPPNKKANGGWGALKQWCKDQAAKLAGHSQSLLGAAIALNAKPAPFASRERGDKIAAALALSGSLQKNFVVVQIDTDIAEDLAHELGILGEFTLPLSPRDRLYICEKALDSWLGGHSSKKGQHIFYCLNSLAMENWVLTLYEHADICAAVGLTLPDNYDEIHKPDWRLISLGHKKDSKGLLEKTSAIYQRHGNAMENKLDTCRIKSKSLDNFCDTLVKA